VVGPAGLGLVRCFIPGLMPTADWMGALEEYWMIVPSPLQRGASSLAVSTSGQLLVDSCCLLLLRSVEFVSNNASNVLYYLLVYICG
jgi:hypothetical protein